MPELRVPFAIDDEERLYSPATAERGKSYFCPACRELVVFRQGKIRIAHFAHKVSETCSQETIIHKTAKLLVQTAVQEWKSGKSNSPTLQRVCQICSTFVSQPLPEKVDSAILEYRLADGSVADVALMVGNMAQAAVEIKVTHAVDDMKANRLPVPFIEVDGYEVIENATVWKPTIDNFKPLTCDQCKSTYLRFQAKAEQVAKASNLELPTAYYRYGLHECWKCKREIIVFSWPKDGMWDNSAPTREPLPSTVQYRYSKTAGGKYWTNTCPYCRSIQGDFPLYAECDGPFYAIDFGADSPTVFDRDMMKMAVHAARIGLL
ncbi:MAG: competence protein CoiA family protein [Phycisphaerae bacterium]|nr:competence protein CoiA family protein [Phycisphaerae bacterium]